MGCNSPCSSPCEQAAPPEEWAMEDRITAVCRVLWDCQEIMSQVSEYLGRPESERAKEGGVEPVIRAMETYSGAAENILSDHAADLIKWIAERGQDHA